MGNDLPPDRVFLFLQGPHGPFFQQLGRLLRQTGAGVWRVGFNAGDATFWRDRRSYIPYRDTLQAWPATCATLLAGLAVTDLVLYGDCRPIHVRAIEIARRAGLRIHVFEEGYLRPYWASYERDGSNGHSRLMQLTLPKMREMLARCDLDAPLPPARWGDLRQHVFYGALYHGCVLMMNHGYPAFTPHRGLGVAAEFRLYLRRLLRMPLSAAERRIASARIARGRFPYHTVLLQLDHDSSFRNHSPFASTTDFIAQVMAGFAAGAPRHHHLVLKAHPLEDGRIPLRREIARLTRQHGLQGRVHYVRGGKLAPLLQYCRSAVTVNSTAAQQVLYRGIPLRIFGAAVYDKPEFVSHQDLPAFFAAAERPDTRAYRDYRRFLLETSQVAGGYYSAPARRQLLRQVIDMMLAEQDPYQSLANGTAAPRPHFRMVT